MGGGPHRHRHHVPPARTVASGLAVPDTADAYGAHFEATGTEEHNAPEAGESTVFEFTGAHQGVDIEPRVACQEPVDHEHDH